MQKNKKEEFSSQKNMQVLVGIFLFGERDSKNIHTSLPTCYLFNKNYPLTSKNKGTLYSLTQVFILEDGCQPSDVARGSSEAYHVDDATQFMSCSRNIARADLVSSDEVSQQLHLCRKRHVGRVADSRKTMEDNFSGYPVVFVYQVYNFHSGETRDDVLYQRTSTQSRIDEGAPYPKVVFVDRV